MSPSIRQWLGLGVRASFLGLALGKGSPAQAKGTGDHKILLDDSQKSVIKGKLSKKFAQTSTVSGFEVALDETRWIERGSSHVLRFLVSGPSAAGSGREGKDPYVVVDITSEGLVGGGNDVIVGCKFCVSSNAESHFSEALQKSLSPTEAADLLHVVDPTASPTDDRTWHIPGSIVGSVLALGVLLLGAVALLVRDKRTVAKGIAFDKSEFEGKVRAIADARVEAADNKASRAETQAREATAKVNKLEGQVTTLSTRVDTVNEGNRRLAAEKATLQRQVAELVPALEQVGNDLRATQAQLCTSEAVRMDLQKEVDNLRCIGDELEVEMAKLSGLPSPSEEDGSIVGLTEWGDNPEEGIKDTSGEHRRELAFVEGLFEQINFKRGAAVGLLVSPGFSSDETGGDFFTDLARAAVKLGVKVVPMESEEAYERRQVVNLGLRYISPERRGLEIDILMKDKQRKEREGADCGRESRLLALLEGVESHDRMDFYIKKWKEANIGDVHKAVVQAMRDHRLNLVLVPEAFKPFLKSRAGYQFFEARDTLGLKDLLRFPGSETDHSELIEAMTGLIHSHQSRLIRPLYSFLTRKVHVGMGNPDGTLGEEEVMEILNGAIAAQKLFIPHAIQWMTAEKPNLLSFINPEYCFDEPASYVGKAEKNVRRAIEGSIKVAIAKMPELAEVGDVITVPELAEESGRPGPAEGPASST